MQRHEFIKSISLSAAGLWLSETAVDGRSCRIPATLKEGDTIAICSPAGYIAVEAIQPAVQQIQSWGLQVRIGSSVGKQDFTFGGTDAERLADLQQLMDDPTVKAILCARGGYGMVRIIDQIDFTRFRKHPKWIIGFSDITVLHAHLQSKWNIASIHSKMCNSFPDDWSKAEPIQIETILSIQQALMGSPMHYNVAGHQSNRLGSAVGALVGGNLKTIESLAGSASDLHTKGKILFVEDTGEYLYSIDRMFWNLQRSGKLASLKGLIVGGFNAKPDAADAVFGKTLQEIVLEKISKYTYPVCFDFPVGHQKNNFALKSGVVHRLTVEEAGVVLEELNPS